MMSPAQEQNVREQKAAQERMDEAAARRAEACTQEEWDDAQAEWTKACEERNEASREAAEWSNPR